MKIKVTVQMDDAEGVICETTLPDKFSLTDHQVSWFKMGYCDQLSPNKTVIYPPNRIFMIEVEMIDEVEK